MTLRSSNESVVDLLRVSTIDQEIILPKRVVPQPQPHLNLGGDCGACVLGGLLGWEPYRIYSDLCDGKIGPINYHKMHECLRVLHGRGLLSRVLVDSPVWLQSWMSMAAAWGPHSTIQSYNWFQYLQLGIDAGHYGIANVDTTRSGAYGPGTNHWVLLCGVRHVRTQSPDGKFATIDHEILVSCSSSSTPDEEWVEVNDFLKDRGGFNVMLAKPK